jgi:hypothetical protein
MEFFMSAQDRTGQVTRDSSVSTADRRQVLLPSSLDWREKQEVSLPPKQVPSLTSSHATQTTKQQENPKKDRNQKQLRFMIYCVKGAGKSVRQRQKENNTYTDDLVCKEKKTGEEEFL